MNQHLVMPTCLILTLITMTLPLTNTHSNNFSTNTKMAVKTSFFISLIPMSYLISQGSHCLTISWKWMSINSSVIDLTLQFDHYSTMFTPIALFVTWSILEFSLWYMNQDRHMQLFFKYLLLFLMAMIILISAGDLFTMFIGWEGVGIMSFLLIGWYFARCNAEAAALQAVLYNRIGDVGFMFSLCWLFINTNSINIQHLLSTPPPLPILFALIIAAASKSAQFSLHPWLASAMEGPTPVSALLHSSTMVVAGIFLLIRIHPIISTNTTALSACLCLGAISTAFAATCALTQNDVKKIIAYSTSSQLGLMMVAIGLNYPQLAFFHICTHAFFKAMLFLCSGSIIHNLNNEQDIRKMGGLQNTLPTTTSCTSIGSLALMGTPFLAGFFSKDTIIETLMTSNINAWALILTLIATTFTAVYSLRIIFFSSMKQPRFPPLPTINENNTLITNPIKRLAYGSIAAGLTIHQLILPNNPMTLTMPLPMKTTALIITILGLLTALDLAKLSWTTSPLKFDNTKLLNTSFLPTTLHRLIPSMTLSFGLKTSTQLMSTIWLEKIGPSSMTNLHLPPIKTLQKTQQGFIKTYLCTFILTILLTIILQLA
uniref:NADH-ubiquinone oxidoreductase chain 5 n=1 Tax=Sooglossus sechellensis TaxID=356330 RepID=K9JZC3_SOOSE|nr:NADH dehydrogenase subunit 5 [Sooglossus sechellensis]